MTWNTTQQRVVTLSHIRNLTIAPVGVIIVTTTDLPTITTGTADMKTSWTPEPDFHDYEVDTDVNDDAWSSDPDRTTRKGDTRTQSQILDELIAYDMYYED